MRHAAVVLAACLLPVIAHGAHPGHTPQHGQDQTSEHFSKKERNDIEAWFASHPEERRALPPGLAKKGKIPPGWRKKLARGKPVPMDVWEQRQPLPEDIRITLPVPPEGVVLVRIHDRVLKVRESTRELLDVLGL